MSCLRESDTFFTHIRVVEPVMAHQKGQIPSGSYVNILLLSQRRVFTPDPVVHGGPWHDKKHYPT